jgi:hypothetical protein
MKGVLNPINCAEARLSGEARSGFAGGHPRSGSELMLAEGALSLAVHERSEFERGGSIRLCRSRGR